MTVPVVLCLSGHDPTGGAGLQADIETVTRFGCHPCTVPTCLTAQDTRDVQRVLPQAAAEFREQIALVLSDLSIAAIKIGLLGSLEIARAVAEILDGAGGLPVVLDPVLAAGGGRSLADRALAEEIGRRLVPRALVVTPNHPEARALAGMADAEAGARELRARGCPHVLLTGTHGDEGSPEVVNRWYRAEGVEVYRWPRLPGSYHGSGCTLAAALAAGLARGWEMETAIRTAQRFTFEALERAWRPGRGQWLPNRRAP
ncbi:bifunctional hydroxymethylpyrimidine kinase/phosphomethylpyrimidine kinase [Candidatus Methylocalor cossyra]|uniref:hydroxymethylpyrimidine kinase n=1 Tax=Candidatus Methylocalor cossyra TaxID=3108543 RepID=A0ABP1C853_9GAMM